MGNFRSASMIVGAILALASEKQRKKSRMVVKVNQIHRLSSQEPLPKDSSQDHLLNQTDNSKRLRLEHN